MFNLLFNVGMELSELTFKLTEALKDSQQADLALEAAMSKLQPLRTAAENAHGEVNSLMSQYQQITGATTAATPTKGKRGVVAGSKRGPRSLEAVIMTSISRVIRHLKGQGKRKPAAVIDAMRQAEKLATGKGQSLPEGIAEKIEIRATEIFGKK